VQEGAFLFKVGDELVAVDAGAFLFVPRETRHIWRNGAWVQSRMILTYIHGGMEAFFEEASPYMFAASVDMVGLEQVNQKYNTDIVGPPLPA
jgi:hypothetical protein